MNRKPPSQRADHRVSLVVGRELRQALEEQRRRLEAQGLRTSLNAVAAQALAKGLQQSN